MIVAYEGIGIQKHLDEPNQWLRTALFLYVCASVHKYDGTISMGDIWSSKVFAMDIQYYIWNNIYSIIFEITYSGYTSLVDIHI